MRCLKQAAGIKKWTAWKKTIDPVEAPSINVEDIEAKPEDGEKSDIEEQKVEDKEVEIQKVEGQEIEERKMEEQKIEDLQIAEQNEEEVVEPAKIEPAKEVHKEDPVPEKVYKDKEVVVMEPEKVYVVHTTVDEEAPKEEKTKSPEQVTFAIKGCVHRCAWVDHNMTTGNSEDRNRNRNKNRN